MRVYGTVVWWKVWVKPDRLSDLFRFKSVNWITPLNDDRALLSRDKLGGYATVSARQLGWPVKHALASSCGGDNCFMAASFASAGPGGTDRGLGLPELVLPRSTGRQWIWPHPWRGGRLHLLPFQPRRRRY